MLGPYIEPYIDPERLTEVVNDILLNSLRQQMKDEAPAERRKTWESVAEMFSKPPERKTGQYFNAFARAARPREPGMELGLKIMRDRNPHYRPTAEKKGDQKNGR